MHEYVGAAVLEAERTLAAAYIPPRKARTSPLFDAVQQSLHDHCQRVGTLITPDEIVTGCNGIPPLVRDYIAYANKRTSAPLLFHVGTCMVVLSTVARRQVRVSFAHKRTFPNIWVLILATPRVYHKTTSMEIGIDLIQAAQLGKYLYPQDTTPEALVNVLEKIPQGTLIRDEFSGFMSVMRKDYGSGLKDLLMALYDCPDSYTRILRKETFVLRSLFLSLLSGTTVTNFLSKLENDDWTTGFTARFLFVLPDEPAVYKDATFTTPNLAADRQQIITTLDRIIPHIDTGLYEVKMSPEALARFNQYGRDIQAEVNAIANQADQDALAANYYEIQVYAVKMVALMAMVNPTNAFEVDKEGGGTIPLDLPTMLAGIVLAELFKDQFRRLRTEQGLRIDLNRGEKLLKHVSRCPGISYRNLLHDSHLTADIFKATLADLKAGGLIREIDGRYYQA